MIIQVCANLRVSVSARFGIATKQCNAATQTSKLSVNSIMNMCNYESLTSGSIRFMATHLTHDSKTNDSHGGLCFFSFGLNAITYKYVVPV